MKMLTLNAPYGVTAIQLANGDEAIYLHGECLACADYCERDDGVIAIGERIVKTQGIPYQLLELPVPDDEGWAWHDVVAALGWGKTITLDRMVIRPVLECCISHISQEDNALLTELRQMKFEGEWIIDTGVGYLIRLEARMYPLMLLKRYGLSKVARGLIIRCLKQANMSMIHFTQVGEVLEGFPTFDW